jgi:hypothetical protein
VIVRDETGKTLPANWKVSKSDELEVKVSLQNATVGAMKMGVKKFGLRESDEIPLHTYAEAGRLDGFGIHAGDVEGVLRGTRLDQVTGIEFSGLYFDPGKLSRANQEDELKVVAKESAAAAGLRSGDSITLHVNLKDGRVLDLQSSVGAPRPRTTILSKSAQLDPASTPSLIHLSNQDELPQDARLNFFLKTEVPETFPPTEKVEVSTADESFRVFLSVKDGNLTLQDSKTVFAAFDPMKLLGPSAFGPLKFRPVTADGIEGDWQPLANLVRIPTLKEVRCVPAPNNQCALSGDKLFLLDAVSTDPDFTNSVPVPEGFVEATLTIPWPKGKTLYIKLRDDPSAIDTATVPLLSPEQ